MKRRLSSIVLIGIVTIALMGFTTADPISQLSSTTDITIIKGQAYNFDDDRYWEMVTFGMSGGDPEEYTVYVNILDKQRRLVDVVGVSEVNEFRETCWYKIDLSDYRINKDFYLEIHFVYRACASGLNSLSRMAQTDAPIDPEETVLIVKYP